MRRCSRSPIPSGPRGIACVLALIASCGDGSSGRPRHLLLITIDTLRADHLTSWGYARSTTSPDAAASRGSVQGFTIDEMAAQGVRFAQAFSPRGETFPSMSTLFTGRTPIETCALTNESTLPASARTLAEILHEAGFRTAAFSANRLLSKESGIEQGFDHFFLDGSAEGDDRTVAAAQAWLEAQRPDDGPPLFVWVHLVGPHLLYDPKPIGGIDFAALYDRPGYAGPSDGSGHFANRMADADRELEPADLEHAIALYDGEVARIDHLISRFLSFCAGKEARHPVDILSDALLVFTADHGEELYERHRFFGHAKSIYGSVLHVPLLLRHPKSMPARQVVDDVVNLEDLVPTLAETFGVEAGPSVHGRSLVRLLRGSALDPRPAFGLWRDQMFTIRDDRWRLVWNPEHIDQTIGRSGRYTVPEISLFDVRADPQETSDVSAAHPDVVADLQRSVRAWRAALRPCSEARAAPSAERLQALQALGYAGDDR